MHVPQALVTIRRRDTRGISPGMRAVFVLGVAFWFACGLALGAWPMTVAGAIASFLTAPIFGLKLRHG